MCCGQCGVSQDESQSDGNSRSCVSTLTVIESLLHEVVTKIITGVEHCSCICSGNRIYLW